MKNLVLCIAFLAATGCKKKDDKAAPAAAAETGSAAKSAEAPKAEAPKAEAPKPAATELAIPGGLAECDAVVSTYKKFQGCTKIKDEDRVVQDMNVGQLPDIAKTFADAKPEEKDMAKTAVVKQCKDQDEALQKLLTAAGC